jgi:phosphoribosylformylglycinamidine synthase PurS subunit
VRQGKLFEVELDAPDLGAAQELIAELCKKLLAHPVIEDFEIVSLEESS